MDEDYGSWFSIFGPRLNTLDLTLRNTCSHSLGNDVVARSKFGGRELHRLRFKVEAGSRNGNQNPFSPSTGLISPRLMRLSNVKLRSLIMHIKHRGLHLLSHLFIKDPLIQCSSFKPEQALLFK
jgi:hypothetical protein